MDEGQNARGVHIGARRSVGVVDCSKSLRTSHSCHRLMLLSCEPQRFLRRHYEGPGKKPFGTPTLPAMTTYHSPRCYCYTTRRRARYDVALASRHHLCQRTLSSLQGTRANPVATTGRIASSHRTCAQSPSMRSLCVARVLELVTRLRSLSFLGVYALGLLSYHYPPVIVSGTFTSAVMCEMFCPVYDLRVRL